MTEKKNLSKYEQLAIKNSEEKDVKELAKENGEILKDKLEGMIYSLNGKKKEANQELKQLKRRIGDAQGTLTSDIGNWLEHVRNREEAVIVQELVLDDIEDTIKDLKEKLNLF